MPYTIIIILVLALVIFIVSNIFARKKCVTILYDWAQKHNLTIIDCQYRYLYKGPYFWTSRTQSVLYFTAETENGKLKSGYAKCGDYQTGLFFSNTIEVSWIN